VAEDQAKAYREPRTLWSARMEHVSLSDAVAHHVRPGDALNIVYGHSRWTAGAREVVRQFWGTNPGFELQWFSLGTLGAMFFRGGLVRKVVTAYSGDGFPTSGPNPIYTDAYRSGEVEIEHWSGLTLLQRLEAAARGLPAIVTGSLLGTEMEHNADFARMRTKFGEISLLAPLFPDVCLMHAPVADRHGNVAIIGPAMEGLWAAWAARRGTIVTVDKIVDDLAPWGHLVQLPAHRVLAVAEAPFGAHPGGMFARGLPAESYGEDIAFWSDARAASRNGTFDDWTRRWCLECPTQDEYLRRVGSEKLEWLTQRSDPDTWRDDVAASPVDEIAPASVAETTGAIAATELCNRILAINADAVLAGAGISNLAAWIAVAKANSLGSRVRLTAEMGMVGYTPTHGDPYVFNHRVFPTTEMLCDMTTVLGMIVCGPGTKTIGALSGAQLDKHGDINTTDIPGTPFICGSGGGADVAAGSDETLVAIPARKARLVDKVAYVTSSGSRVRTVCTNLGIMTKREHGELSLSAVPIGAGSVADRIRAMRDNCGWDLAVDREVTEFSAPTTDEIVALRRYDPQRLFLAE
jgi:acyl CoA:acetate/3-ketoacid CoA transferase alpha subunit/acyl CoA:acetate/3-ketoacid CoA transferase beta subunit